MPFSPFPAPCTQALFFLGFGLGLACGAAEASDGDVKPRGYLSLQVENDMFGNGADRHYTHGTQLSYATAPGQYHWVEDLAHHLHMLPRNKELESRVTFSLGQAIFTPADISRLVPDSADRPFAGWLYLSAGLIAEVKRPPTPSPLVKRVLHRIEFSAGVVGPASLAKQAQQNVHEWIGAPRPRGWDYQLKNEPALLVSYELQKRYGYDAGYLEFDATPHAGVTLGNVYTLGAAGVTLRIGHDMLDDFGPPRIRPSTPGAAFFEDTKGSLGWYIFAGFEGRGVARNLFLDGSTFAHGPSVDKRLFVGDAQLGAAVTYGPLRLSFTNIYRTREFKAQKTADEFGAITLSVRM